MRPVTFVGPKPFRVPVGGWGLTVGATYFVRRERLSTYAHNSTRGCCFCGAASHPVYWIDGHKAANSPNGTYAACVFRDLGQTDESAGLSVGVEWGDVRIRETEDA